MPETPETSVCFYFDESGAPLDGVDGDGRFVIGGVAIRGDSTSVRDGWKLKLAERPSLGRKGTKYSKDDMLETANFLIERRVLPLASFALFDEDDLLNAERKVAVLAEHRRVSNREPRRTSARTWVWINQVMMTVVGASLGRLPFMGVPIEQIHVFIDKFGIPQWLEAEATGLFALWCKRENRIEPIVKKACQALGATPAINAQADTYLSNLRLNSSECSITWQARGPLGYLADAMAAIFRRALAGDTEARPAWDILRVAHSQDGRMPACMNWDLTHVLREQLAASWPGRRADE